MADRDSSRRTRQSGRLGGNRPRTHPKGPQGGRSDRKSGRAPARPPSNSTKVRADLANIRARLGVALAVVTVASMALKHQNAEADADVALLLQRCVADELFNQLDRLDHILGTAGIMGGEIRVQGGAS
jgi:hypothetical protein